MINANMALNGTFRVELMVLVVGLKNPTSKAMDAQRKKRLKNPARCPEAGAPPCRLANTVGLGSGDVALGGPPRHSILVCRGSLWWSYLLTSPWPSWVVASPDSRKAPPPPRHGQRARRGGKHGIVIHSCLAFFGLF